MSVLSISHGNSGFHFFCIVQWEICHWWSFEFILLSSSKLARSNSCLSTYWRQLCLLESSNDDSPISEEYGRIYWWFHSPAGDDLNLLGSWIKNNNIVISWILNSISKDISTSIVFSDSSTESWSNLKERFQQSNAPYIFQLWPELMNLVQNQNSLSVHFTKLKILRDEQSNFHLAGTCWNCTCGGVKELNSYFQTKYVMTFPIGLNYSFAQIRGPILLLDPIPPLGILSSFSKRMPA